ncbi:MAG: bifunctional metallophosphatase/5'-nucleotidase [Flavobacteriaceae bacterium]|nr:MAG: bifunctional metallophosphatase/5'-nucleotidase [Flavobacteriaceae bacterium]
MKSFKLIAYSLLFCLLLSCNSNDHKIDFTFLQVNDVYEIAPIQGGKYGGMARLEALHQELVKENTNTFLFIAGDFLNPSLLGTIKYNGEHVQGKQMVEIMNAMNFELAAFGNHEFDLSQKDLQKRLNESTFHWIGSNVTLNLNGTTQPFYKEKEEIKMPIPKTYIKEIGDEDGTKIKIGFISVCIPSNPKSYVSYSDMFEAAKSSYEMIKDNVDIVFGLTHVKIEHDKKIAELIPEIPLIMGGHEHTHMRHRVGNTIITKADANAKTAYVHKISFDKKTKKITIASELKEINTSIIPEKKIATIVNKWQDILNVKVKEIIANPDETIYRSKVPLEGRDTPIRSEQTNLGKLVARSMAFAYNDAVDCAIVNSGSIRIDDTLEGAVTGIDIFRVLPYGGAILKIEIKGSLLQEVLEFGAAAKGRGAYLQRYRAEKKNTYWTISGKQLDSDKIYTVAISDYLIKGFDIPVLNEKNKDITTIYRPAKNELEYDIRKAMVHYLKVQYKESQE